jgi:hypothetical protein
MGHMFADVVGCIVSWGLLTSNYCVRTTVSSFLVGLSVTQGLLWLLMSAMSLGDLPIGVALQAAVLAVLLNRHEHHM